VTGIQLPTPAGYNADMDLIRTATYPLRLLFKRRTPQGIEDEELVVPTPQGRLGGSFSKGPDGRPILKTWNLVPGAAETSGLIKQGNVLVKVGEFALVDWQKQTGQTQEECILTILNSSEPIVVTHRDMALYNLWKNWAPGRP